jgi:hypothetical protein
MRYLRQLLSFPPLYCCHARDFTTVIPAQAGIHIFLSTPKVYVYTKQMSINHLPDFSAHITHSEICCISVIWTIIGKFIITHADLMVFIPAKKKNPALEPRCFLRDSDAGFTKSILF